MLRRLIVAMWSFAMVAVVSAACNSQPSIPPLSQFTRPAVGTPIPPKMIAAPLPVPPDGGGVAFYNQKGALIHVVLSDSISIISPTYGFLFPLAPGTYNFYVYESDAGASLQTEKVEQGKVRYVYIYPMDPDELLKH